MQQVDPVLAASVNDATFKQLAFHHTAQIICDGTIDITIDIKNERLSEYAAWTRMDEIAAVAFSLDGGAVPIQVLGIRGRVRRSLPSL